MKLPAGMVDRDFEFFLHKGELLVTHDGRTRSFDSMPAKLYFHLMAILEADHDANYCLDCMDIPDPDKRLRQFVLCRFSSFDLVADITEGGNMHPEFTLCDKRGRCPFEGTLCLPLPNYCKLSSREIQVIKLIADDFENKMIAEEMNISVNTVSTHIQNINNKLGTHSKYGMLKWAFKCELIDTLPECPVVDTSYTINHY